MATTNHQKVAVNQLVENIQPLHQAWRRLAEFCKLRHNKASASTCSHHKELPCDSAANPGTDTGQATLAASSSPPRPAKSPVRHSGGAFCISRLRRRWA